MNHIYVTLSGIDPRTAVLCWALLPAPPGESRAARIPLASFEADATKRPFSLSTLVPPLEDGTAQAVRGIKFATTFLERSGDGAVQISVHTEEAKPPLGDDDEAAWEPAYSFQLIRTEADLFAEKTIVFSIAEEG